MARIPDETRDAVAADLRAGELSVRAIATAHGVSPAFVSRLATSIGVAVAQRSQTKRATEAKQADIAARQAQLASLLLDDAFKLRDRAWEPQTVAMSGKFGIETIEIPTPAGDFRNFYTSIGIIVDKVGVLTRDESEGLAAVDSWLRSVVGS